MTDIEQWTCPICLDALFKPCITPCGHIFCFWCLHKAVNWRQPSSCAYCRHEYLHQPGVCEALHHYMRHRFPEDTVRRETATKEEERLSGTCSFAVNDAEFVNQDVQDFLASIFACVSCGAVARAAVVQGCGHLICGHGECSKAVCPKCSARRVQPASRCRQVRELISSSFPECSRHAASNSVTSCSTGPACNEMAEVAAEQEPPGQPDTNNDEIHCGVGCDACHLCPVRGRRYWCLDCPERIGYDLCGRCYDHSLHHPMPKGRFNQTHRPEHRMQLMEGTRPRGWRSNMDEGLLMIQVEGPGLHDFVVPVSDRLLSPALALRQYVGSAVATQRTAPIATDDNPEQLPEEESLPEE